MYLIFSILLPKHLWSLFLFYNQASSFSHALQIYCLCLLGRNSILFRVQAKNGPYISHIFFVDQIKFSFDFFFFFFMLSNAGKHKKLFLHKVFYRNKQSVRSIFILQVRVAQNERERERERERPQVWDYTIIKKSIDYILAFYKNS